MKILRGNPQEYPVIRQIKNPKVPQIKFFFFAAKIRRKIPMKILPIREFAIFSNMFPIKSLPK